MITINISTNTTSWKIPDFRAILLFGFAALISANIFFSESIFFSNNWFFGILILLVFPYLLGHIHLDIFPKLRNIISMPAWVSTPILWVIGLFASSVPGILLVFIPGDIRLLYLLLIGIAVFGTLATPQRVWKIHIPNIYANLKKDTETLFWFIFAAVGSAIFYYMWGRNLGFTSLNPDNLQNMHLANLINETKEWSLRAFNLSPQYNQIDYFAFIPPLQILGTYFFDYRYVMEFMFSFEMVLTALVYVQRFALFKYLKISSAHSALLSGLSVMFSFGGLYQVGSFYNQQVLTHCLPAILYFTTERKFVWTLFTHFILLPIHFTFSVFLLGYSLSFFYFEAFHQMFKSHIHSWTLNVTKVGIITVMYGLLIIESMYTFEVNYLVSTTILSVLTNPQYANTVGIFSNIEILQLLKQGLGPFILACLLAAPLIWFTHHRSKATEWAIFIIIGHIALFTIPFPVAARTIAFIAIPICLTIYSTVYFLTKKQRLATIGLTFIFVTYIMWSFTIRPVNLNISGDYINYPFLSRQYLDNLRVAENKITHEHQLKPEDYEVVAEFFSKHHLETISKKYNDNGVYEENIENRIAMHQMLSMERGDACLYWQSPHIIYFLNEKSYKWSRTPESLAVNSVFSIWFSPPANELEKAEIRNIEIYHTTGTIIEDTMLDDSHRFILIQC